MYVVIHTRGFTFYEKLIKIFQSDNQTGKKGDQRNTHSVHTHGGVDSI